MSQETNIHAGHKKRLREKFELTNDFTGFKEHEILEVVLNYVQKRKNTNEIAHKLIKEFGSFDAVFDADKKELMKIKDVGEVTASYISMLKQFFSVYEQRKHDMTDKNKDDVDFHVYVKSLFEGVTKEQFYVLCVGENGRISSTKLMSRGSNDSVLLDCREIARTALERNAGGVICAHNHLTGIVTPSNDDILSTKKIRDSLDAIGVKLIDHYIVAGHKHESVLEDIRYKLLK